jgi:DNA-binding CsgD family transcriptional regulator
MDDSVPGPGRATGLRGRSAECALLDRLVSAVHRGESRSLVLRGEAGVGKTALLDYLITSASELNVVRAVGVESEMELAYASLNQVCAPLLDRLERLPAPQRRALEIVLGLSGGAAPDRFLVGLAVLSLLSEAAEERPLLCVVDDAQWLDQASTLTLAFVARRLVADPVGMVFSAREPGEALQGITQVEVRGLRESDARALLTSVMQSKLDERVRDRIIAEARGNPLALLELPQGLTATELVGGFGLLEAQALAGRIEESFIRQLEPLAGDARRLLLIAAAEPVGDPLLLWRAAERLAIGPAAAEAAAAHGLVAIDERVIFRHPLVRSAVYGAASVEERRTVHRALAESTDREADPDRRAWHLAAAAVRPDEQVASELERSAGRAAARGGLAAAAAFLQRSVLLSQDPARRGERALAAAQASLDVGAFDTTRGLLITAEEGLLDESQRARIDLLRAHLAFAAGLGSDAPPLLSAAAKGLEPFDLRLARETYMTALLTATAMVQGAAGGDDLVEIARAVRALPRTPGDPRALDLLVDGLALLVLDGHAVATPTLQGAARALTDLPVEDVLRWGWMATAASAYVWDVEGMHAISARQVELVRDAGALTQLPFGLNQLGLACAWMGDFTGAASCASESDTLVTETGSPVAPYASLRLRALQGREAETAAAVASVHELAAATGQAIAGLHAHWAAAVMYNGLARYEEAESAARQATPNTLSPWLYMSALPELVEAAARAGDTDVAHDALDRLAETTEPVGTDVALGIEARSRALLSDGETAERLYREAIYRLGRTSLRPELARAHLLYGEWLRRQQRRADARAELRAALVQFTSIGMQAFAERARKELLATGEKARKRAVKTRVDLTAQERQIAELARDGLSNPEIGARLFLSPRTVEWHLGKVFGKLEIRSRHELGDALAADADAELMQI